MDERHEIVLHREQERARGREQSNGVSLISDVSDLSFWSSLDWRHELMALAQLRKLRLNLALSSCFVPPTDAHSLDGGQARMQR